MSNRIHRLIQEAICKSLPENEGALEWRIGARIADLFWEKEKIVFEVQCSPISLEEAVERSTDYKKMGLSLVWILHQRLFNKQTAGLAELYLRTRECCYYSNMTRFGDGLIYDQKEIWEGRRRSFRSEPLIVDLSSPHKKKGGALNFEGDLSTRELKLSPSHTKRKEPLSWERRLISMVKERYLQSLDALLRLTQ